MELLVGEALDQRLAARGALGGPELDKIFTEVARAVGNAHELGVVHRDIKPANIFLAREGGHEVTKVLDFGIAKLTTEQLGGPAGAGTHTGIILGTPRYMSPEQARGTRDVDHRSDLWSLAVLAFECLTGRQPFESTTLGGLVVEICTAAPRVPSSVARVPTGFDAWFARGVSKAPEARFQSALEMAEELHALLAAEGLAGELRPRSSTDRRGAPELHGRVAAPTRRGPSFAPPVDLSPTEVLSGPQGGTEPAPTERSITNAGPVSTEVLHPRPSARRGSVVIAVALTAAAALGLGLGRALLHSAPSREGATPSSTPAAAAPAAPAALPAPVSHQPAASPASATEPGPSGAAVPLGLAQPPSQMRTADPLERAPRSKSPAKRRPGKAPASGASPVPASPPPASNPTPQAFDPYSDRL
jgi:serine/threonine-protein kinase